MKQKSLPALLKQAQRKKYTDAVLWKAFSQYIRLRDADENGIAKCFTCNVHKFYRDMDCGHGHGRQHLGSKYSEKNNHAQCGKCQMDGGRQDVYKTEMDKKYGAGTWDLMEVKNRATNKRFSAFEFEHLTKHYLAEFEKLKLFKKWIR